MKAGKYRHSIAFESPTQVREGEFLVTGWAPVHTDEGDPLTDVPAEVLTGPGRELLAAGTKHGEVDLRINLRWFPGLESSWRVNWEGKPYDITGISADATGRREYRLLCKGGVSDGR